MIRNFIVGKCSLIKEYKPMINDIVANSLYMFFKSFYVNIPNLYNINTFNINKFDNNVECSNYLIDEIFTIKTKYVSNYLYINITINDEQYLQKILSYRSMLGIILSDIMKSFYLFKRSEKIYTKARILNDNSKSKLKDLSIIINKK